MSSVLVRTQGSHEQKRTPLTPLLVRLVAERLDRRLARQARAPSTRATKTAMPASEGDRAVALVDAVRKSLGPGDKPTADHSSA